MAGTQRTPTKERHEDHDSSQMHPARKAGRHPNRYATLLPPLREHRDSESSDAEMEARPRDSGTEISSPSSLFSGTTFSTEASEDDSRPEPPPLIHALFEELSQTWQFVVADPVSRHAVIVDPQRDNAPSATTISTIAADRVLSVVQQNRYSVDRILHTHEPRDHPSSAWYLRAQLLQSTGHAPKITIGKTMAAVQRMFKRKYSMKSEDGSTWKTDYEDTKFSDGQSFAIGNLRATALQFPGGTYAFVIGQHIFAGASRFDLEIRARNNLLIHDLKSFQIYTSKDAPPQRRAQLVPMYERERRTGKPDLGKKLVIRYGADNGPVDFEDLE
ncbi:Putative ribonuclease Z/Hydroxyacylglutathione hydrolase [Septoria linicola]|uniref:Ribonuclease Z/Hydroxyacylglutathione hydrolase n=1 Tax=Septoria linicola TaxID=215465 RepID=A0A9Q9EIL1_9PEZI|nr:putative ribonuclease Z/Hydroxyacylglutathione hydrolase [Septoria linicola]USW51194.1 Putative ribonuclease Z/Hydroxyacylglutathione hydrolase [Septoria linicola]